MAFDLTNRVALVTGGGTGIGREISMRLAQRGADVVISYAHSRDEAERSAGEQSGRPRVKLYTWGALLDAAQRVARSL